MGDEDSSVRVGLRIRPQIPREVIDMCRICTTVTPGEPQVTLGENKSFTFDYVFDTFAQQEEIYDSCVANLIDGALKGYNATVLAYGQTGSGKTFTMGTGFEVDIREELVGIIPRAISHLFRGIEEREVEAQENNKAPPKFTITAQFMELYNEDIIDLFEAADGFKIKGSIKIQEAQAGGINVVGVASKPVLCANDALHLLRTGALSRTTASTQMNSESSRSHAIFTLIIKQQRLVDEECGEENNEQPLGQPTTEFETLSAKFHFVDLAGSERLKRTGATGERAREGISINCGLLALGNVISALGDKSRKVLHVPYRDSKLTRLLQDSLGGNSQTLMIACVSPSDRDFMETLNTLKYANRARNIKNRVTVNQDSSSKMIVMLRTQILQLELELSEYRQGKRVVGEDGTEAVNDMFHENTMLQSEMNNMRTRVKALQETIDTLKERNTQLLTEHALTRWGTSDEQPDVTEIIKEYLTEIEDLRTKLLESEKTCEVIRKRDVRPLGLMSPRGATGHLDVSSGDSSFIGSILAEAKRDVQRDLELLKTKEALVTVVNEKLNGDEESSDSSDNEENEESDTDTEEKVDVFSVELAHLTTEISTKQKLIDQLEMSQHRIHVIKQQYEEKLNLLQTRIRSTQEERDKMLTSFAGSAGLKNDKGGKKARDDLERKLSLMQKELKKLQSALKKHEQMAKAQSRSENELKMLKNDMTEMKRAKVKLINRMKEESAKHKIVEEKRNREIAQLRKETRKRENQIRTLEADKKMKDVVLRRKNEEVSALRKTARNGMSSKAAGRLRSKPGLEKGMFSPKVAKQKWQTLEKNINKIALNKQAVATMERNMDRKLRERETLSHSLEDLIRRRKLATNESIIADLDEQIDLTRANIDYIQDGIAESQQDIMTLEEAKENFDGLEVSTLVQAVGEVDEARYLIEKLYNMTVNQSYLAAQKELNIKETEAKLAELTQKHRIQEQLLEHMVDRHSLDIFTSNISDEMTASANSIPESSSASSSRSTSPTPADACNGNTRNQLTVSHKIRRRTALPEELLYPGQSSLTHFPAQASLNSLDCEEPPHIPVIRVPSAPDSLRLMTSSLRLESVKPSPVMNRKVYDRQESTSPRAARRATVLLPNNLFGKPGSMEQGLDASPPNSPTSTRRGGPRDENVFSRLTFGTNNSPNDHLMGKGIITSYTGKVSPRAALICTHIAKGHSRAVQSVDATNEILFSASKDRTVKIWDLHTGKEVYSLLGHPNNVQDVKYHEESRLIFSMSSYFVKVWDFRDPSKCIKTLCSSGLTSAVTATMAAPARTIQFPQGESLLNAMSLNHSGSLLYTAAGDKVRIWDLRRFDCTGKLSGGHQAAVMCLTVGKLSEDEDVVITGSKDHYVKVFEVNRKSDAAVFTPKMNLDPPHYDGIQSLAIRGDVLFSGSRDMSIKKWDLSGQEPVQPLNNAHKDWVTCLRFMPGGQKLLSGCRRGVLKLWSVDTCTLLGEVKAHSETINAVTTNKASTIFTASNDGGVHFWRINSRYENSVDTSWNV